MSNKVRVRRHDGGPAFARAAARGSCIEDYEAGQDGMSLRDYFAGQALAALRTHGWAALAEHGIVAAECYALADAMLAARKATMFEFVDPITTED